MTIYRSWKAPTAPSAPRTCSARARHADTPSRPHDLGHRPQSQRSFLWPKRLTAGGAAAKEASSGAVGPGEALGTLVTISGYVKRPRYARLNIIPQAKRLQPGAAQAGAGHASGRGKRRRAGTGRAPPVAAAKHWRAVVHHSGAIMHLVRFFRWRKSNSPP